MRPRLGRIGIVALLFSLSLLSAERELPEIRLITTHPARDLDPAVSPDGRWLAYTSDRSGNPEIWVRALPRGRDIRVTDHPAEDAEPVWSPDGRWIVFVSKRRDPEGDLYRIRVETTRGFRVKGRPHPLTTSLGAERSPAFSPEGRYLVYVTDTEGGPALVLFDFKTRRTRLLTPEGGETPTWSPDGRWVLFSHPTGRLVLIRPDDPDRRFSLTSETRGPAFRPTWSGRGNAVYFERIDLDSVPLLLETGRARTALWRKTFVEPDSALPQEGLEIQITAGLFEERDPCWHPDGSLLYVTERNGNPDIETIAEGGLFPLRPDAATQYAVVVEQFGTVQTQEALRQALLGYRRVLDFFPTDSLFGTRALIRIGELEEVLGHPERAIKAYQAAEVYAARFSQEAAQATLKRIALEESTPEARIRRYRALLEAYPEDQETQAEGRILLADACLASGRIHEALEAYRWVTENAVRPYWQAQARLKIGDLFAQGGDVEAARQAYFTVLSDYGRIPLWRDRAAARILGQITGPAREAIPAYRRLIREASGFPALVAQAQLAIARALVGEGDYDHAIKELEEIPHLAPGETWAQLGARIFQARLFSETGDELKGILRLETLLQEVGTLEGGMERQEAEKALFSLLFESAERLRRLKDYDLAASRYQKALRLRPNDIETHRGLVECFFRTGRIERLIDTYANRLSADPENPVLLYAMGLALSYRGEHEKDPDLLKASNRYLEAALRQDYRMVYPYRAMSYNYELLENLLVQAHAKKRGFWEKAGRRIVSPFTWTLSKLPFVRRPEEEGGYYEQAIEQLVMALELNDEALDPLMESRLAQNLANNFYHLGEFGYRRAFSYYGYRLSLDTTFTDPLERAVFYERAGRCGALIGEYEQAERFLRQAIASYRRLGREADAVENERMLAFQYQLSGRYEEAYPLYQRLARQDELFGRREELLRDYRNIAYNLFLLEEYEEALVFAKKAEALLQTFRIVVKPPQKSYLRIEILGFSIPIWGLEEIGGASSEGFTLVDEAAFVYGLLSRAHERLGDIPEALAYEKKRLDLFKARKDRLAERIAWNRIGILAYRMGFLPEAWKAFETAGRLCAAKKDLLGWRIQSMNLALVALTATLETGDTTLLTAARMHLEAFRSQRTESMSGDDLALRIAEAALEMARRPWVGRLETPDEALKAGLEWIDRRARAWNAYTEALQEARSRRDRRMMAVLLKNLGELTAEFQEPEALRFYAEALRLLRQRHEAATWRVTYALARAAESMPPEALKIPALPPDPASLYREALSELESLPIVEGEAPTLYERMDRDRLYLDAALSHIREGRYREAFETLERRHQKRIADLVAMRPPRFKRERHNLLWGNLRFIRRRIYELESQIRERDLSRRRDALLVEKRSELSSFQAEHARLLEALRAEDPVLAYLSGLWPIHLTEIQTHLPEKTVALVYTITPARLVAFALDHDSLRCHVTPIDAGSLGSLVRGFRMALSQDSLTTLFGEHLYHILMGPFVKTLQKADRLLIVPDGILWTCPFEALIEEGAFLLDRRQLFYAPSLTAYRLATDRTRINTRRAIWVGTTGRFPSHPLLSDTTVHPSAGLDRLKRVLETADLVHLRGALIPAWQNPLRTSVVLDEEVRFRFQDFFGWDLRASLFSWEGPTPESLSNQDIALLYLGLLYAGTPTLLFAPGAESLSRLEAFYPILLETDGVGAITQAQRLLKARSKRVTTWTGMKLIGFEGFDPEGRLAYARAHLVGAVRKARAFRDAGEFRDALLSLETALDLAEAAGDTMAQRRLLSEIIATAFEGQVWDRAIRYQKQEVAQARKDGDQAGLLRGLGNLSVFYLRSGDPIQAANIRQEFLRAIEARGDSARLGRAYEEMGFFEAEAGRYVKAAAWAGQAVGLYRRLGDPAGEVRALFRVGRFHLEGERLWDAESALKAGLALVDSLERIGQLSVPLRQEAAGGRQLLGLVYERMNRYNEALASQQEAISAFEALGLKPQVALGYQYMANLHWKRGDYRQALGFQKRALDAFSALQNKKELAMAYSTLGLIQMSLGQLDAAFESEQRALALAQEAKSPLDEAAILNNLGLIVLQTKEYSRAEAFFRSAATIDSVRQNPRGLAYDRRNLGMVLIKKGEIKAGIRSLTQALSLSRLLQDTRNLAQCFYGLAEAALTEARPAQAVSWCDSALTQAERILAPELTWRVYRLRGQAHALLGQEARAYADYLKAIEIVEAMRAELKVEAFKQGFLDTKLDLYVDMIRFLVRSKRIEEAMSFAERAKSRNFIDLLANQRLALGRAEGELLEKERLAKGLVEDLEGRLASLRTAGKGIETLREEKDLEEQLRSAREAYQAVLDEIAASNPELSSLVSVRPLSFPEIREALPQGVALLHYFLTPDAVFVWFVAAGQVLVQVVSVPEAQVQALIQAFRESIRSHLSYTAEGQALYQILIRPFESEIGRVGHLVVIPHGLLHSLPFAALQDASGRFLTEKVSLSLAPSATVLVHCLKKGGAKDFSDPSLAVVAFSNPQAGDVRLSLPFADKEVVALRREYPYLVVYSGVKATEQAVKQAAPRKRLLHFACHATYEPDAPLFSALLLNPAGEFEDGRLEAHEIFGLGLDCDLVMLSACETGLAKVTRGDEIIGLARAFLFAGAPSLMTSLWKVDDLATAVMVKRFYRNLRSGLSRAEALRQAQLHVKEAVDDHPAAWAAFTLTGEFR